MSAGRQCIYLKIAIWNSSYSERVVRDEQATTPLFSRNGSEWHARHSGCVTRSFLSSRPPSSGSPASTNALQAFEYFRSRSVETMSQQGPQQPQWIRYALQMSSEPALLYAMAAVAAVQSHSSEISHTTLIRLVNTKSNKDALMYYTRALTHLQVLMKKTAQGSSPVEPVLLCCLLFLVFEATQGNIHNAAQHVRLGRRIAAENCRDADATSDSPLDTIRRGLAVGGIDAISDAFSRLDLNAVKQSNAGEYAAGEPYLAALPSIGFRSLEEAGAGLENLIEARRQIQSQLLQLAEAAVGIICPEANGLDPAARSCLIHTLSRSVHLGRHTDLQHRLTSLMYRHDSWKRHLDFLFSPAMLTSQTSILIQVWFFMSRFTLFTCRQTQEILSDYFENECIQMLNLIERFLRNRKEPLDSTFGPPSAAGGWHRAGIFEFGMLPAIFTIASKCRASHVRWRAVEILRNARRREAMNDSASLALYAQMIIRLEEHRAGLVTGQPNPVKGFSSSEVPEEARFLDAVVSSNVQEPGCFTLVGTRIMHESGGKLDIVIYKSSRSDPSAAFSAGAQEIGLNGIVLAPLAIELQSRAELMVTAIH